MEESGAVYGAAFTHPAKITRSGPVDSARLGPGVATRLPDVPNPFPSLKARVMLRLLQAELGYSLVRRSGSHRRLVAVGRPELTFAFHDRRSLTPVEVRDILVKQVGLSVDDALKVVRGGR